MRPPPALLLLLALAPPLHADSLAERCARGARPVSCAGACSAQLLPHAADCGLFYHCEHPCRAPACRACPGGLHFDPQARVCDWPALAGCRATTAARPSTTESSTWAESDPTASTERNVTAPTSPAPSSMSTASVSSSGTSSPDVSTLTSLETAASASSTETSATTVSSSETPSSVPPSETPTAAPVTTTTTTTTTTTPTTTTTEEVFSRTTRVPSRCY
ncbi:uncharacterized protein LOC142976724 [Anticarsia gemmatalis]|uniref:uncharacterized protein LOC142976724 n=1 Tax=Anticarsia gemmatalis TaxID=129554 RepID=UPI003F757FF9